LEDDALDFEPNTARSGRHLAAKDLNGATVHVDMRDGQVTSVHGEHNGKPVETFIISGAWADESADTGEGERLMASRVSCWLCACSGGSCTCRPYPCPGGGG
jgi:hypothetical protein